MKNVLIIQETLPHYRVEFFNDLRGVLADRGIELQLAHGVANADQAQKRDAGQLPWAIGIKQSRIRTGHVALVWQHALPMVRGADLVVVEQANRMLINYVALALQPLGGPRVALWGHGENLQAGKGALGSIGKLWKQTYSRLPHWWFAYTEGSAERVHKGGFRRDRITVVQNAIGPLPEVPPVARVPARCVYVGGLYAEKRLDLLIAAGDIIAAREPAFSLEVMGDGPLRTYLESAAKSRAWLHVRGPVFGSDKTTSLARAELVLMPGLVGLAVLDSFQTGTPMITTADALHSPEYEYLIPGVNGLVTAGDPQAYADGVLAALQNPELLGTLRDGCTKAAGTYTLDAMVTRFARGIEQALA